MDVLSYANYINHSKRGDQGTAAKWHNNDSHSPNALSLSTDLFFLIRVYTNHLFQSKISNDWTRATSQSLEISALTTGNAAF